MRAFHHPIPPACRCICLSVCLSSPSVRLPVCQYLCVCQCLSMCLSVSCVLEMIVCVHSYIVFVRAKTRASQTPFAHQKNHTNTHTRTYTSRNTHGHRTPLKTYAYARKHDHTRNTYTRTHTLTHTHTYTHTRTRTRSSSTQLPRFQQERRHHLQQHDVVPHVLRAHFPHR